MPRRTRHFIGALGIAVAGAICTSPPAFALNPALDVSQYAHTAWKIREGFAKGGINDIAQTPDGYLWLGTDFGLLRFDGVRAVPWQPPSGQSLASEYVMRLLAARDGTLWIATIKGLAAWNGRTLTGYPAFAGESVGPIFEDREGTIWVSSIPRDQLCAIRQGRVECSTVDDGRTYVAGLFEDRSGTLWAGVRNGLWRWKPGPPAFITADESQNGFRGIVDGDAGSVLVSRRGELLRVADGRATVVSRFPEQAQRFQTQQMLRDRDGGIWIVTTGGGVVHVHQGKTDVFARTDGLSSDGVRAIYEDREHNIWVGTDGGLDRFHETAVSMLGEAQGLSSNHVISVLAGRDGSVWLGLNEGLNRWKNGQLTAFRNERVSAAAVPRPENVREVVGPGLPEHGVHSLFEDSRGRLWIPTGWAFGYLDGERFVPVDVPRSVDRTNTYSIAEDSRGAIWIATLELGLVRVDPGGGVQEIPLASLNRAGDMVRKLVSDPAGDGIWVGFEKSGLAYLVNGQIRRTYSTSDGLAGGRITSMYRDADGTLWIGAEQGLSRLKDGRITTFTSRNGLPCDRIHWVIEDAAQSLWMDTPCGLVRAAVADLAAAAPVRAVLFDASDGVPLMTEAGNYSPHVARSQDGRLWFTGNDGVNIVDPKQLSANALPPPVHIELVSTERDVQIEYTALSLAAPEKVRFRYRLDGYDRDWQDAGNRRQAFYTNLPPRSYRFRVIASNNSGVWNETGDAIDFSIAPAYYQTLWFRAAAVLFAIALIWALYQYRLRQIDAAFEARLQERVGERTRIARELHDTLLQSFHGLLFRFQAVTNMLPARPAEAKRALEGAIEQAADAIAEGRDAVQNLRTSTALTNDLAEAIHTLGDELAATQAQEARARPLFDVAVEGVPRDLYPILRDDIYRIAGEAMRNAFRHAHARRIEVNIRYDARQFQLRVRDDGSGIDPAARDGRRSGHFGLPGMRERAELIGGSLDVWSQSGLGTEVELTIPAAAAYGSARTRGRRLWPFVSRMGANS